MGLLLFLARAWVPAEIGLGAVLFTALIWWGCAFLWVLNCPTSVPAWAVALAAPVTLIPGWLALLAILDVPRQGLALAFLALATVSGADMGAILLVAGSDG